MFIYKHNIIILRTGGVKDNETRISINKGFYRYVASKKAK